MGVLSSTGRKIGVAVLSAGLVGAAAFGISQATQAATAPTPSNSVSHGRGINEFGMTKAYYRGRSLNFTYTKGYFCDLTVKSSSTSGCEAGANFHKAPSKQYDPLYITVPLGFSEPMADCPPGLVCVDHPGTIGLGRLEPALKPLYPNLSDKQLLAVLKKFSVPEHDHFITDTNGGKAEWWDVKVIGVTSKKTFEQIRAHKSYGYIQSLLNKKDKTVVGPIPTNLFLFFGVN